MDIWNMIVNLAGILATPVLILAYAPQIKEFYVVKKAEGVSTLFWLILDLALLMLFILAVDVFITTGAIGLIIAQSLNLGLALVTTGQVIYYKQKTKL